ncbi:MAG: hypothetical protein IJH76_00695 [Clostridia bacterium]|nr:hypothetical protein [Clostridia bacterium]
MDGITTMEERIAARKREVERAKRRKENSKCINVLETKRILMEEYNLRVPDDFEARAKKNGNVTPITDRDVGEIWKIANFWRPAIKEEFFDEFMISLVAKFFYLRSVAINNNPICGYYIGKLVQLKEGVEGKLPFLKEELVTTAMSSGGNAYFVACSSKWKFNEDI